MLQCKPDLYRDVSIPYSTIKIDQRQQLQKLHHMFQFLIVRLKLNLLICEQGKRMFQFLIVRLKSVMLMSAVFQFNCFNSL